MARMFLVFIAAMVVFLVALMFSIQMSMGNYRYCEGVSDCAGMPPSLQCDGDWVCELHSCKFVCYEG